MVLVGTGLLIQVVRVALYRQGDSIQEDFPDFIGEFIPIVCRVHLCISFPIVGYFERITARMALRQHPELAFPFIAPERHEGHFELQRFRTFVGPPIGPGHER